MSARQAFKKLLVPGAAVVGVANGHTFGPHCAKCTDCTCKPSELPIYPTECQACKQEARPVEKPPGELEAAIGKIRSELWVWKDEVEGYKQRVITFAETGIAHSSSTIDILREESNGPERVGAIGLGALSGLVLGLRGGVIKRLTYATVGGLSMAAICYPRAAAEYSDLALQEGNRYFVAGYHFLFGETPKMPGWLETVVGETQDKIKEVTAKSK